MWGGGHLTKLAPRLNILLCLLGPSLDVIRRGHCLLPPPPILGTSTCRALAIMCFLSPPTLPCRWEQSCADRVGDQPTWGLRPEVLEALREAPIPALVAVQVWAMCRCRSCAGVEYVQVWEQP